MRRPPAEPLFGYLSLCDDVLVPVEGEDFTLAAETKHDVSCDRCVNHGDRAPDEDNVSLAHWDRHLVRYARDEDDRLERAHLLCDGPLKRQLEFEPPEFSGDLQTQVETVCEDCWDAYTDRQWSARDGGAELAVDFIRDDGQEVTYYAESLETDGEFTSLARLVMVSPDGLRKEITHEQLL